MAIVCTTCNAENPEGSVFCEECGIELSTESMPSMATPLPEAGDDLFEAPADSPESLVEDAAAEGYGSPSLDPLEDELTTLADQAPASESLAPVTREIESASLTLVEFGNSTNTVIPLNFSPMSIGKFDPAQGPIDIDLGHLTGNEYISRKHAELYFDDGWTVRDLGSTNGVFIRRQGQSNFLPRLQTAFKLENGDEVAFGNIRFVFQKTGA